MKEHLPALLLGVPLMALLPMLFTAWFSHAFTRALAFLALSAGFLLTLFCFPRVLQDGSWKYALGGWAPPWGVELVLTPFTCLFLLFLSEGWNVLFIAILLYTSFLKTRVQM